MKEAMGMRRRARRCMGRDCQRKNADGYFSAPPPHFALTASARFQEGSCIDKKGADIAPSRPQRRDRCGLGHMEAGSVYYLISTFPSYFSNVISFSFISYT